MEEVAGKKVKNNLLPKSLAGENTSKGGGSSNICRLEYQQGLNVMDDGTCR